MGATDISFSCARATAVSIRVYDLSGRRVCDLVNAVMPPGAHSVHWNGTNDRGVAIAPGVYIYRMTTAYNAFSRKLILQR